MGRIYFKALLIGLLCNINVGAQENHFFVHHSYKNVRAYPANSYDEFRCNLLDDNVSYIMSADEIMELNELISLAKTPRGFSQNSIFQESGLFIEVGKVSGIYLSRKGYREVTGGAGQVGYGNNFPAKLRTRVDSFINKYQQRRTQIPTYHCFNQVPILCRLVSYPFHPYNFIRSPRIIVEFLVSIDSLKIIPIDYVIKGKKRQGVKDVVRTIPFWDYYSSQDLGYHWINSEVIQQYKDKVDSTLYERLVKWFPSWPQMTDQERMRMLDNYILEHKKNKN